MPNDPSPPVASTPSPPPPRKRSPLAIGCGVLLGLALLVVLTVLITLWWIQRPIKPVVLSAREKATVEEKLQHLTAEAPATNPAAKSPSRPAPAPAAPTAPEPDRP